MHILNIVYRILQFTQRIIRDGVLIISKVVECIITDSLFIEVLSCVNRCNSVFLLFKADECFTVVERQIVVQCCGSIRNRQRAVYIGYFIIALEFFTRNTDHMCSWFVADLRFSLVRNSLNRILDMVFRSGYCRAQFKLVVRIVWPVRPCLVISRYSNLNGVDCQFAGFESHVIIGRNPGNSLLFFLCRIEFRTLRHIGNGRRHAQGFINSFCIAVQCTRDSIRPFKRCAVVCFAVRLGFDHQGQHVINRNLITVCADCDRLCRLKGFHRQIVPQISSGRHRFNTGVVTGCSGFVLRHLNHGSKQVMMNRIVFCIGRCIPEMSNICSVRPLCHAWYIVGLWIESRVISADPAVRNLRDFFPVSYYAPMVKARFVPLPVMYINFISPG